MVTEAESLKVSAPYKAKAIANFFLDRAQKEGIPLTQMKLQKLVYFAHGWCLAIHKRPLIDERVQAWDFGPVIRTIYDEFKAYGKAPITTLADSVEMEGTKIKFVTPRVPASDVATIALLNKVWDVYKRLSAYQLSNLTHQPESPWDKAYSASPGVRNLTIDDKEIEAFFKAAATANRERHAGAN